MPLKEGYGLCVEVLLKLYRCIIYSVNRRWRNSNTSSWRHRRFGYELVVFLQRLAASVHCLRLGSWHSRGDDPSGSPKVYTVYGVVGTIRMLAGETSNLSHCS